MTGTGPGPPIAPLANHPSQGVAGYKPTKFQAKTKEKVSMATRSETPGATKTIWKIDPAHSQLEVSARHMMVTTVKGRFKGIQGTLTLDEANPAHSTVEAEIDASSLDTGV